MPIGRRSVSRNKILAAAGTAVFLALASPAVAPATAPGTDGKIFYQGPQSGETGPTDIFSINPNGSEALDLTSGSLSEERPNVSADGRHVVFQSFRDEGWNIFSMNADGSNQVDLTNTNFASEKVVNFEPTWSPDGNKVVFMHQNMNTGEQDLWSINANGTDPINLTESSGINEASAEFSPDGTKIVYVSSGPELVGSPAYNNDIWVMNANGSGQTHLTETNFPIQNLAPTWSPDGTKIAYSVTEDPTPSHDGLHVMNANGSSQTQLLNESSPILTDLLSWSPDGTKIAFKSVAIGGELRLVGASGGPSTLLVENSGADYPSWAPVAAPVGAPTGPTGPVIPIATKPGNHFAFGKLKLNKKKGTAKLFLILPGPGGLTLTGKGVKKDAARVRAAGNLGLPITPVAAVLKALNRTGTAKVKLKITFAPRGGSPKTVIHSLSLKKIL
jgi:Tol biopolymer transport system component